MPAFLRFYQGALTRDMYWQLSGYEFKALYDYRDEVIRTAASG